MGVYTVKNVSVTKPGSPPDIDTDYNTVHRDKVIGTVRQQYGVNKTARIGTRGMLKAKSSFKDMATIYEMPFKEANRISALIPGTKDGKECSLADIYNSNSERYTDGAAFRDATNSQEWKKIVDAARAIEGRTKSVGTHACGVILSSHPLSDVIPVGVDKNGDAITEYEYAACENLGLIKIDFLGLDTVDIIQNTIQTIINTGKTPPNMMNIINGDMDDKPTYNLLSRGDTIAVFQLSSPGVQELLRKMKPTKIDHIAAITALYRPGPMGMNAHLKYADRIGGREPIEPIHPEFAGTILDTILEPTASLIVFQEQVIEIAQKISGFTGKEGDKLRKAIGKKQTSIMETMRTKFLDGGQANGYSLEAMTVLWDTVVEFSKYAFNQAHAYSYALLAYQTAFLKANYPVEFMSTCIEQTLWSNSKEKRFAYMKEAERMGIRFESINVNTSGVKVAPNPLLVDTITYSFPGVNGVSAQVAETIVREREEHGLFTGVEDFVSRCWRAGVVSRRVYENIALAGGFDVFGVSRRQVFESVGDVLSGVRHELSDTDSIFGDDVLVCRDFGGEDYSFLERLQREGAMLGLYLSAHPLSKVPHRVPGVRDMLIGDVVKSGRVVRTTVMGVVSSVSTVSKGGRKVSTFGVEDGTGFFTARLGRDVELGVDVWGKQQVVKDAYLSGKTSVPEGVRVVVDSPPVVAVPEVVEHHVYSFDVVFYPAGEDSSGFVRIVGVREVPLGLNGVLPVRVRFDAAQVPGGVDPRRVLKKSMDTVRGEYGGGDTPLWWAGFSSASGVSRVDTAATFRDALIGLGTVPPGERSWPPPRTHDVREYQVPYSTLVDRLPYKPVSFMVEKCNGLDVLLGELFGVDGYDYGVFTQVDADG